MIASVGLFSCQQDRKSNKNNLDTAKLSQAKNIQSQKSHEKYIHTTHKYIDSEGGSIIIQNSFPKGEGYTDPNGKEYFKTIFFTRIINETDNLFELKIDFPVNLYKLPSSVGKHFKILLASESMTLDKVDMANYGLADLNFFLDNSIHRPSSLKKTIHSKESSGFYVLILFEKGLDGTFRTGLSIKGKNLFYRVARYAGKQGDSLVDEKEINCGSINLKNLVLQK